MDEEPDMHLLNDYLLWNYPSVIPQAIILLEAIRTVPAESRMYRRAWARKRLNAAETLFVTIKYTSIIAWCCNAAVENSTWLKTVKACNTTHNIYYFLMFYGVFLVALAIAWRTYVIFQCSRQIYWFLTAALSVHFALTTWTAYRQHKANILIQDFCNVQEFEPQSLWHYSSPYWLVYNVLYDAVVTGVASWRLLKSAKHLHGLSRISRVLFYNNLHYAVIVCSSNLAEAIYLIATNGQQRSLLALSCAVQIITGMNLLIHEQDVVHDEAPAHVVRARSYNSDMRTNHSTFGVMSAGDKANNMSFGTKSCTTSSGLVKYDMERNSFGDLDATDLESNDRSGSRPNLRQKDDEDVNGCRGRDHLWLYGNRDSTASSPLNWDVTPPMTSGMSQAHLISCPKYDQGSRSSFSAVFTPLGNKGATSERDVKVTSLHDEDPKGVKGQSDMISLPVATPSTGLSIAHSESMSKEKEKSQHHHHHRHHYHHHRHERQHTPTPQQRVGDSVTDDSGRVCRSLSISSIRRNMTPTPDISAMPSDMQRKAMLDIKTKAPSRPELSSQRFTHERQNSGASLGFGQQRAKTAEGIAPLSRNHTALTEDDRGDNQSASWCSDASLSASSTFGGEYHGSMVHLPSPSAMSTPVHEEPDSPSAVLRHSFGSSSHRLKRKQPQYDVLTSAERGEAPTGVRHREASSPAPWMKDEEEERQENLRSSPTQAPKLSESASDNLQKQQAIRAPSPAFSPRRLSGHGQTSPVLSNLWRSTSVSSADGTIKNTASRKRPNIRLSTTASRSTEGYNGVNASVESISTVRQAHSSDGHSRANSAGSMPEQRVRSSSAMSRSSSLRFNTQPPAYAPSFSEAKGSAVRSPTPSSGIGISSQVTTMTYTSSSAPAASTKSEGTSSSANPTERQSTHDARASSGPMYISIVSSPFDRK